MAKKETTKKTETKKTATKKVTAKEKKPTTKKTTVKKTTPKKEVVKEETKVVNEPKIEVEEKVTLEAEAPMVNIVKEDVQENDSDFQKQVLKHVVSEMLAEKNNSLNEFVKTPREEMFENLKEKIENIKKINNKKINDRIDSVFGYLWNGQEIDYQYE